MIKHFLYITILTFVVIVVWIGLTVYWSFQPKESLSGTQVNPIQPNFDFPTVQRLEKRQVISADFSKTFTSSNSAIQSIDEPSVIASPSGEFEINSDVSSASSNLINEPDFQ